MADLTNGMDASVVYATQGNIGFPNSSALKTIAEAKAVRVANAYAGSGMTISAATIPASR